MSHIQEIEKEFEEKFAYFEDFFCDSNGKTPPVKDIKSFLRQSHLKYLQSKKKELEGEIVKDMLLNRDYYPEELINRNVAPVYNLAKQEEIDKIIKEINET